jgi:hypothetical protein
MKKMFLDQNNKIHKQLYISIITIMIFLSALITSENYLQADESGRFGEKPTEEQIKAKLSSAVSQGKLTQEEADSKLKSILSGDFKGKKPGRFGVKPTEEQIKAKLISAVSEGKLTQDEADSKLKSILSGDFKGKKTW